MKHIALPSAKRVASYVLLPGILPRLQEFSLNFGYLAYLMALVFEQARLIPRGHVYLQPHMQGQYGIKDVLALAAHNLKPSWNHSDQYLIFGMFMLAVVLMGAQFLLLLGLILTQTAHAMAPTAPVPFVGMFITANPEKDIAFNMMDKVFGIPGFFNSASAPASIADISPFTRAMQSLFEFYSMGMLIVAGLIVCYFAFVVTVETAQTGSPFGKRFASVYAPVRLCIAVLLLLPISYGYNIGQSITLTAAKWGSSLATNSWLIFIHSLSNPLGLVEKDLVAAPKIADIGLLLKFYTLAHTCRAAYQEYEGKEISPYIVRASTAQGGANARPLVGMTFDDALTFSDKRFILIRFGEQNDLHQNRTEALGNVYPYCGELRMDVGALDKLTIPLYREYFELAEAMWSSESLAGFGRRWVLNNANIPGKSGDGCGVDVGSYPWPEDTCMEESSAQWMYEFKNQFQAVFDTNLGNAVEEVRAANIAALQKNQDLIDFGWGGAGIWFNKIAETNGALVSAAYNMPHITRYPDVLETVVESRKQNEINSSSDSCFGPNQGGPSAVIHKDNQGQSSAIARILNNVCVYFQRTKVAEEEEAAMSGNYIVDYMTTLFGLDGLFSLREQEAVHPLAQMTSMGRSIIDRSIKFLSYGFGSAIAGGFASTFDHAPDDIKKSMEIGQKIKQGTTLISGFIFKMAWTGLTVGFILYYIIPFMPFIYFFFAVGRWVKTIFEAMVGVPLWALAHLRIDGEGIPAQAAANGYYLILEILLRPILTLFGMMAAISIFTAMAIMLNFMFDLAVFNLTGHDPNGKIDATVMELDRGPVDAFFYTFVYAILLYMMAVSSFKLIDLIPNGVLRWAGSGVNSFGDKAPDPGQGLIKYTALGGMKFAGDLGEASQELSMGIGQHILGAPFSANRAMKLRAAQEEELAAKAGGPGSQ